MDYYKTSVEETLKCVDSTKDGITDAEAAKRLKANGLNKLASNRKTPLILRFLKQLADPMIIILLVAAIVSLVLTLVNNADAHNEKESFADVIIITAVVLLNVTLGVVQESKAEKALEALKSLTEANCKVLREGVVKYTESANLAVGDLIILEAGDGVPADCRIIESASCKAEESALTGESVPVDKQTAAIENDVTLGDRKNMLYAGSSVVYGRAAAVVVATGASTEMGKIANLLAEAKDEKTPLQVKMAQLSKILTYAVAGISLFIFAFHLIKDGLSVNSVMNSLFIAIGLAVASIPEGLATVVTIVLSLGVTNMSRKNAVVRKLTAVETLGCCEIICTDKTGTLTQNVMTVTETYGDRELIAKAMALCCDARLSDDKAVGEPTECALVNYALESGVNKTDLDNAYPRVAEAPFDSERKMMSTLHNENGAIVQYTKGAPDEILSRCKYVMQNGKSAKLTEKLRQTILTENKKMANKALRALACAYASYDRLPDDLSPCAIERDLTFVGLCGMTDPVRPEAAEAIARCKQAGIRPVMITGDHIDTAVAVALQLNIISSPVEAITGSALDSMTDEELMREIPRYSVYARVQPEHKVRIVNAWKSLGKVCAMTGDGVNDAPSIKKADIGVGMGITGTDVTKQTADMILADDNFATIVTAVQEGRRIYDNICKAIQFLLSSNLAEVISVFVATVCGFVLLKPAHLLWINLITDTLPAVALGTEQAETDVMSRPPRNKNEGIFSNGLGVNVITHGILIALVTLSAYFIGCAKEANGLASEQGMTMAFLTMSVTEMLHAFNTRSLRKSAFKTGSRNTLLWIATLSSLALTTAVIFVPYVNTAFGFADANGQARISLLQYMLSLLLAFAVIPIVEIQKLITNAIKRKSAKKHK
ncbi:MAG: cation-translocating P-type ATPase [Firmicutes bacterium]|nr:cation-translocating P-type ATPase [Bacillota bacterium]